MRDEVGGDEARVALRSKNKQFCGPSQHIDFRVGGDDGLGGRYIAIARATNHLCARDRSRAVGERGDGLRPAKLPDFTQAEQVRSGKHGGIRLRTDNYDALDSGDLRGNGGHQQRRKE